MAFFFPPCIIFPPFPIRAELRHYVFRRRTVTTTITVESKYRGARYYTTARESLRGGGGGGVVYRAQKSYGGTGEVHGNGKNLR